jgi:hypothetical protein
VDGKWPACVHSLQQNVGVSAQVSRVPMLHAFSYHILGHKCEWSHKCRVYPIQGKLSMYISTGNV